MTPIELRNVPVKEMFPGFKGRFIHSETMTVAYWHITAGCVLQEHSHPHEQIINVLKGTLEIQIGEETHELQAGSVLVVPSHQVHGGIALTDCEVLDVFHPVREDYR